MSPPRFYCPQIATTLNLPSALCFLDPAEAKHATAVLRLSVNDQVALFDGAGHAALGKVVEARRDRVGVEILQWCPPDPSTVAELTLAIALPKGDRQKTLVDAATELGVHRLIPLRCERGVAQPTENALDRLRRQVIEACKQCGRNRLMEIAEPWDLAGLAQAPELIDHLRLIAHPYRIVREPEHLSNQLQGTLRTCVLAIGPEGGFSDPEVRLMEAADWHCVTLGPLILRIEVAALAAVAQITGWYQSRSGGDAFTTKAEGTL